VDVVDWATTGAAFQRIIEKEKLVIQQQAGDTLKFREPQSSRS